MLKQSYKDKFHDFTIRAEAVKTYLDTSREFYAFIELEQAVRIGQEILEKAGYYKTRKVREWIENLEA